jgi:large subunit ribosomal protein L25
MEQVTLRADQRTSSGSRPAKRLRREGRIPAIVYGRGQEAVSVTVSQRDLYGALHTEAGLNALINLEIDGGDTVLSVAREIQRHPVRGEITHLDFIKVSLDVAIQADVGLDYVGDPVGVREEGGFVEAIENSVLIEALPTQIPSSIEVDINELGIGDTLKVADLPAIEGVEYVDDPERPLVTVLLPRVEEEPVVEELLEGEELEAALEEEGAAPEAEETAADEEG